MSVLRGDIVTMAQMPGEDLGIVTKLIGDDEALVAWDKFTVLHRHKLTSLMSVRQAHYTTVVDAHKAPCAECGGAGIINKVQCLACEGDGLALVVSAEQE